MEGNNMNNLDYLCKCDREQLITMISGECEACKIRQECEDYECDILCSPNWLLSEHVDTWNSLMNEAKQPNANAFDIFIRCEMLHNNEILNQQEK